MVMKELHDAEEAAFQQAQAEMVRLSKDIIHLLSVNSAPGYIGMAALAIALGGSIRLMANQQKWSEAKTLDQQNTLINIIKSTSLIDPPETPNGG